MSHKKYLRKCVSVSGTSRIDIVSQYLFQLIILLSYIFLSILVCGWFEFSVSVRTTHNNQCIINSLKVCKHLLKLRHHSRCCGHRDEQSKNPYLHWFYNTEKFPSEWLLCCYREKKNTSLKQPNTNERKGSRESVFSCHLWSLFFHL